MSANGERMLSLSWLYGGRQLVFSATAGSAHYIQLRTLDVTGTGTNLVADSRALFTADDNSGASACVSLQITPDGGTAICSTVAGIPGAVGGNALCVYGGLEFIAFPLPISHQPGRVLYHRGGCQNGESFTLWTDASGGSIIGVTGINAANEGAKEEVGVITGGRFRPLNIAKSVPRADYLDLAF